MKTPTNIIMLLLATLIVHAAPLAAQDARPPVVETLASYPHGAFLENLVIDRSGAIVFTSYFAKSLMILRPGGQATELATLPAHPVGILETADGFVVTAHAVPFTNAPAFLSSNKILILGRDGAVRRTIEAPDARFLNGLVALSPDKLLIADSVAGLIWVLNPASGTLAPWLRADALAADPAATQFLPAANGLKLHGGALYVSNSSRGAIYRQKLTRAGEPDGPPGAFVRAGPVDDFAFAGDGSIYAATHGARLLRIAPDGQVSAVLETGCDACTSIGLTGSPRRPDIIALTTGNLLEGGDAPARVLRISTSPR